MTNYKLSFYSGIIQLLWMQFKRWKWEGKQLLVTRRLQPPAAAPGTRVWEQLCSDSSAPFFQTQIKGQKLLQCGVPAKGSERLQEIHLTFHYIVLHSWDFSR